MRTLADYTIGRKLGEGSFGDVHAAFDKNRRAHVALKRLRSPSASTVYRFRNEFRALADIFHPNLVTLYDLFPDKGDWYISMELVEGPDIVSYARRAFFELSDTALVEARNVDAASTLPLPGESGLNVDHIRNAFAQLTCGVRALHNARKLHRDLKPSNVLVAPDGTVKILDFGLVTEIVEASRSLAEIVGTPAYMAPEQTRGEGVSEAADWYAVGAMLYETLVGHPPFHEGDVLSVIAAKNSEDATDPRHLDASLPEPLCELSLKLLQREPSSRPPPVDVENALRPHGTSVSPPRSPRPIPLLVGRERETDLLAQVFARTRRGHTVVAHVVGASGHGKTTLVRELLRSTLPSGDTFVLEGRCYEGEAAPFKAVDTVMSALASRLQRADPKFFDEVRPRDFDLLTRLFPVLQRVPSTHRALASAGELHEAVQARRRAFAALRDMMGRIAERRPLIVFIDDFQWGDADSVALLAELVRGPDAPPFLLIVSYRDEEIEANSTLRMLRERVVAEESVTIQVAPLGRDACWALARTLLREGGTVAEGDVEAVAVESGGNPFFLHELARLVAQGGRSTDDVSVGVLISDRLAQVSEPSRAIMQVVSLAASGLTVDTIADILPIRGEVLLPALASLRNERLIRSRHDGEREIFEAYHDRIRERVRELIEPPLSRELHGRVATALEKRDADPEILVLHFLAAERPTAALEHAERAALAAADALAFDRAVALQRLIVELTVSIPEQHGAALIALADALVRLGHSGEAAALYESEGNRLAGPKQIELWRRAFEQFLVAGELQRGLVPLGRVLASVGLPLLGPVHAILLLIGTRFWLAVRGTARRGVRNPSVVAQHAIRFDICASAAIGLVLVNNLHSAAFAARLVPSAFAVDDPLMLARAITGQAIYRSTMATRARHRKRARRLLEIARAFAKEAHSESCDAFVHMGDGVLHVGAGRWEECLAAFARSLDLYRTQRLLPTLRRESHLSELLSLIAEIYSGSMALAATRRDRLLRDAVEHGDLFLRVMSTTGFGTLVDLARDDTRTAITAIDYSAGHWPKEPYSMQRQYAAIGRVMVELYRGHAERALEPIELEWPLMKRSGALYSNIVIVMLTRYLRSLVHLTAARRETARHLRIALAEARAIERGGEPWTLPFATAIRAGIACARKEDAAMRRLLEAAAAGFEAHAMAAYAAAARYKLGSCTGGDAGRKMASRARDQLEALGVRKPTRFVRVLLPDFGLHAD